MTGNTTSLDAAIHALDAEVRDMLREDLPAQRDETNAALAASNWLHARNVVHAIHGSAAFCRLHDLQSAAAALETQLDQQHADDQTRQEFLDAVSRTLSALN